jgi:hypothetical protein
MCMSPIAMLSERMPTSNGRHKCRENWPTIEYEKIFNLFLCLVLFIIPLVVLTTTYSLISMKLWEGLLREVQHQDKNRTAHMNGLLVTHRSLVKSNQIS